MNGLLLSLVMACPAELPQSTLLELPQSMITVKPVQLYEKRKLPRPSGYHEHSCTACGMRWGHGESSFGNPAEHSCPNCGRIQWSKAPGIQLPQKVVNVPTKQVLVPVSVSVPNP